MEEVVTVFRDLGASVALARSTRQLGRGIRRMRHSPAPLAIDGAAYRRRTRRRKP